MKNSLETKLGIFVIFVVLAIWAIVETLGSTDVFSRGIHVSAAFDTVQDLKVGDRVKMAGVEIGRVEAITLASNKVSVVMKLRDSAAVQTDSKATIKFTGLMGQNFVAIDFGAPGQPKIKDGMEIPGVEQPDLSAMMAKLGNAVDGIQNMTKSFSSDDIHNLFGPLGDFFKENRAKFSAIITDATNISGQIASGKGTVGKLIYDDTLYNTALTTVSNVQDTVAVAKLVISDARAGKGTIGKLLTDDTLYASATGSMTNLHQILLKVNQGDGTIGKLVNDQEFYKNAKLSLQKLDKAADSLEDTGPMSVIGVMANQFGL